MCILVAFPQVRRGLHKVCWGRLQPQETGKPVLTFSDVGLNRCVSGVRLENSRYSYVKRQLVPSEAAEGVVILT